MDKQTSHLQNVCFRRVAWTLFLLAIASLGAVYAADSVQFPDGFRRWVRVDTAVILPGANPQLKSEEGMHHVFANEKAAAGYAAGNFTDGAVIVYELRDTQQKNGVILEGDRKRVDVMIKDSSYKDTGGWRFERFWGADQAQNALHDSGTTCFQCHSNASAHGFVFSKIE
jgi:Cytochrome P460